MHLKPFAFSHVLLPSCGVEPANTKLAERLCGWQDVGVVSAEFSCQVDRRCKIGGASGRSKNIVARVVHR